MLQQARVGKIIASFDYGERKLGTAIGYQRTRKSPIRPLFAENINLFPKKLPTVEYLMRKFNMWPNDCAAIDDKKLRDEDAQLMVLYKTVWPAEFEKQEADLTARKKQLTLSRKKMQTMIEKGVAVTDDVFINTKKAIAELEADKTVHEDGVMVKTRWNQFVLRRVFSSEDVDDEEEDDDIPTEMDEWTFRVNTILSVYFEFWATCLGRTNVIGMEKQVLAIGAKGALGQASMGALMLNLANPGERDRPRPRYVDPKFKLRVFPFHSSETQSLVRGGKVNPKWWMPIGETGNIKIQMTAMSPKDRKQLLPNFPDLEGYIADKKKVKEAKRIAAALVATAQPSANESNAPPPPNSKKRKREESTDLILGEDEDDVLQQPSFVAAWSSHDVIDLDSDSDGDGFMSTSSKPTLAKKSKSKPKETNAKSKATTKKKVLAPKSVDEDDELMPAKKKKSNFGNPNRGATSYAYFSIGDKKTAESRIFNKKEAVRRVKLLFDEEHDRDIEGARWKLRYQHKWNDDDRRDVADAFLQLVYCLHEAWQLEA